jgi:hypothetical protein
MTRLVKASFQRQYGLDCTIGISQSLCLLFVCFIVCFIVCFSFVLVCKEQKIVNPREEQTLPIDKDSFV